MSDDPRVDLTQDLKGLVCPIPVVRLKQAIGQVSVGGVVEAFATDPGVLADIPAWCKATGNELVKMEREDKIFRFLVRRTN